MNQTSIDLFKFLRDRAGLSAHRLSIQAGLSASYVSKIENGAISPSVEALAKLIPFLRPSEKELNVLIRSFLDLEDNAL